MDTYNFNFYVTKDILSKDFCDESCGFVLKEKGGAGQDGKGVFPLQMSLISPKKFTDDSSSPFQLNHQFV